MDGTHFVIHPLVDGYSGCLHFVTIMNNAAINICVQVFLQEEFLNSLGYILSSGIARSANNPIFNILKNCKPFSKVAASLYTPTSKA